MKIGKVKAKIRKLLALARSSNRHEAASAIAKAEKLMQEHDLSDEDASPDRLPEGLHEVSLGSDGFMSPWKFVLVSNVARRRSCEAVGLHLSGRRKVRIVGRREDAERAAEEFGILCERIEEAVESERKDLRTMRVGCLMRLGFRDPRDYFDSFRRGASICLSERLRCPKARGPSSSSSSTMKDRPSAMPGKELALDRRSKVSEYIDERYPRTKVSSVLLGTPERRRVDPLALERGYRAALTIAIPGGKTDVDTTRGAG